MQLTPQFVECVLPPASAATGKATQVFYRDSKIIGFGLRVASGGTKSYILERRIRGKVKRITLGHCQQLSFDKAKRRALRLIEEIERENAPRIHGKITDEHITLQQAYSEYLNTHPELSQATLADYQRSLQGPLKDWQSTAIMELTEERILLRHELYSARNRARCNNAMRLLRAVLNHARLHFISSGHKPIISHNPVDVLSQRGLWYPRQKVIRQRWISPDQLYHWWQASFKLRRTDTREYFQFLLFTGLSHSIASKLRFSCVDFVNNLIVLNTDSKDQEPVKLPIPVYLTQKLMARRPNKDASSHYVFSGLKSDKPIKDPRMAIKQIQKLSGVYFTQKILQQTFMHFINSANKKTGLTGKIKTLNHEINATLSEKEIALLRETQERILLCCVHGQDMI